MNGLLVLDFDGVICDSIDECFVSSWEACQRLGGAVGPVPEPPAGLPEAFARLRPYVRTGEDFLVMLHAAEHGDRVGDQTGFDALARREEPGTLARFKALFYAARERLLAEERTRWLSLNRVYPHAREALLGALDSGLPLRILSTKKAPYILEILGANGIVIPAADVHYCASGPKVPRVRALLARSGCQRAAFVDDQIDYLLGHDDARIDVYLASWGYVRPEWLAPPVRVPLIDADGLIALVGRLSA